MPEGGRVQIIAGGGVTEEALAFFARSARVSEVHVGRAAGIDNDPVAPVSAARIRRLRQLAAQPDP